MRGPHLVMAAVALTLAGAFVACGRDKPSPRIGAATRIVSLGPASTETLFAVGAGDRTVGRSRYCDWPPEATHLPVVGGIDPDVEAIVGLAPDLVVGPSGGWSARLTQTLGAHGIATWFPDEITSLAGVDEFVRAMGVRTGDAQGAEHVVGALHAEEAAIERAVAGLPRPRVLLVVQTTPVVVAGPASFATEVVTRAGGASAVTDGGAWPIIGFERLAEIDPDVVVDASIGPRDGPTRITAQAPGWGALEAVKNGHVVALGDERILRPGPRIADGIAALARALHPGLALDAGL